MAVVNRRNFLASMTSGVLGFGLAKKVKANLKDNQVSPEHSPVRIQKYNPLGKTGLKVSDISCGAISFFEPNVLRYAYDLGVNYFDTAEGYLRTKSESYIGEALKDVRDKIYITTKHFYPADQQASKENGLKKEDIIGRVDASLKRMQTDYVDIAMLHSLSDLSLLRNEELQAAYSQLKKEGKIRFTGFSTHNAKATLKQALDQDFVQVILFIYNHMEGKDIEPLIQQVRQKGIGTVAMKVFAGGRQGNLKSFINKEVSYPQSAIRWVLSNSYIDCCIPTMSSYSHVEEYVAASKRPLNRVDLKMIDEYQRQANQHYCRVSCQACLSSCPNGVAINDILRCGMYFENYRMEKEAMRYYADLEKDKKPLDCDHCNGYCVRSCPYGLKVRDRLLQAHEILTV